VTVAALSEAAGNRTGGRVAGRDILVIQDTSEIVLSGRSCARRASEVLAWALRITVVSDRESDLYEDFALKLGMCRC